MKYLQKSNSRLSEISKSDQLAGRRSPLKPAFYSGAKTTRKKVTFSEPLVESEIIYYQESTPPRASLRIAIDGLDENDALTQSTIERLRFMEYTSKCTSCSENVCSFKKLAILYVVGVVIFMLLSALHYFGHIELPFESSQSDKKSQRNVITLIIMAIAMVLLIFGALYSYIKYREIQPMKTRHFKNRRATRRPTPPLDIISSESDNGNQDELTL